MTEQAKDILHHGFATYWIVDSPAALFVPHEHGLRVAGMRSTANRRGFTCEYAIVDGRLRLRRVDACLACPETPARARLRDLADADLQWLDLADKVEKAGKSYAEIAALLPMSLDEYRQLRAANTCVPPALFGVPAETGASPVPDGHDVRYVLDVPVPFTGTLVVVRVHHDARTSLRFRDGDLAMQG